MDLVGTAYRYDFFSLLFLTATVIRVGMVTLGEDNSTEMAECNVGK